MSYLGVNVSGRHNVGLDVKFGNIFTRSENRMSSGVAITCNL